MLQRREIEAEYAILGLSAVSIVNHSALALAQVSHCVKSVRMSTEESIQASSMFG